MPAANPDLDHVRTLTLRVLAAYVVASTALHAWNLARGSGDLTILIAEIAILGAIFTSARSSNPTWRRLGDWLPLLALPVLYAGVSWSMPDGTMHDAIVQRWDRGLFGTQPARTMAGAMPWWLLSEILHLAYFSYFAVIYAPPLFLYLKAREEREFRNVVLAFTVAMVASFIAFIVFPVEGPRYGWPAPAGVPSGPVRRFVLWLLETGSTRGTAFPSSHVAISLAISLAVVERRRTAGWVLIAITVLLGAGAVYGGFHYATDVVAGMALGLGSWGISSRVNRRSFGSGSVPEPHLLP